MKEMRAKEFRSTRSNELRKLSQVLVEGGLIRDPEPLASAAAQANERRVVDGQESWGYDFHALEFTAIDSNSSRRARPKGAVVMAIELSVTVSGPCIDDNDLNNPFTSLGVDIVAIGLSKNGRNTLKCAWHFDRHKQGVGMATPTAAHPIYHFQHGGENAWGLSNYGEHLILEPPRIAHPPLDAILAVDFVLSNYCGSKWSSLCSENATYKQLVALTQERYWGPYALATATVCKSTVIVSPWKAVEIWPQILIDRVVL